jgi:uncharacterized protein (TIGR02996 family)
MEAVFLADILARPADDTPRLVFADWRTERDGPGDSLRAEFIRVQCELARLGTACDGYYCDEDIGHVDCRGVRLGRREQALWEQDAHLAGMPDMVRLLLAGCSGRIWRRGFLEHITLSARHWCDHHRTLLAVAPLQQGHLLDRLSVVFFRMKDQVFLHNFGIHEKAFATLSYAIWQTQPHDGNQPGLSAWWVPHVWPGITFHGPDFD